MTADFVVPGILSIIMRGLNQNMDKHMLDQQSVIHGNQLFNLKDCVCMYTSRWFWAPTWFWSYLRYDVHTEHEKCHYSYPCTHAFWSSVCSFILILDPGIRPVIILTSSLKFTFCSKPYVSYCKISRMILSRPSSVWDISFLFVFLTQIFISQNTAECISASELFSSTLFLL